MTYRDKQQAARNKAIDWQSKAATKDYSYSELAEWQSYFEQLGRKYGVLREYRSNGIC